MQQEGVGIPGHEEVAIFSVPSTTPASEEPRVLQQQSLARPEVDIGLVYA